MKFRLLLAAAIAAICTVTVAYAAAFAHVTPSKYDPKHTFLVASLWVNGIGCPTGAKVFDGTSTTVYSDAACLTGDSGDTHNQGLLLAKTGPTGNYAAAQAKLSPVPSQVIELGYDIKKPVSSTDPRGSHCGAGAPRFDIISKTGTIYFLGCNSPAATQQTGSVTGWTRLRWDGSTILPGGKVLSTINVAQIWLIFDEGTDTGPDNMGMAVLDNIDVNGTLVGHSG